MVAHLRNGNQVLDSGLASYANNHTTLIANE